MPVWAVRISDHVPALSHAVLSDDQILITGITKAQAKELGARWLDARTAWALPAARQNAAALVDMGIGLPDLREALVRPYEPIADERLYEYQRHAAGKLASSPHGLLVTLSPGLGKTAVAIAAADFAVPDDRIIVIAPASLLRTWEREIARWAVVPGGVYIMQGKLDYDAAKAARWIITSWDKAAREIASFGKGWPLVILDESVLTKSRNSKRFKAMKVLRGSVKRMWLLSGSPTTRHADDLWAQLHLLWPAAFPSYWRFAERYCYIEETPWAKVVTGTRSNRDAAEDNSDLMLVVNQQDVLPELPDFLIEPPIEVSLSGAQARAYRDMEKTFMTELRGEDIIAANEIARLMKLQQIASWWDNQSAKRDALVEVIRSYDSPYLVWTHWRETAVDLFLHLAAAKVDVRFVTGDTPDRDVIIEAYKRGEFECLVLSLGVGKFGLTLTNTKTVFYVDRSFNADDFFQSMHRVRRIGLDHRPVVVPIVASGTVDELTVGENLETKMRGIARMTRSDLAALVKGLGR